MNKYETMSQDRTCITYIERDGERYYHRWHQGGTTTNIYDLTEKDKLSKESAYLISKYQGFKVIELEN